MANKRIDVDAEIDRIRLKEQTGNPSTPSNGYGWLFEKSDTKFYAMNDAGQVFGPIGEKYYTLTVSDELTVASGLLRLYNLTGKDLTIGKVHLAVNTAPIGDAVIADINENGSTIFSTQANRPEIAVSGFTGETTTIDDPTWASGNYLQADVDQIGSTIAGADLTITIVAS
jgi:hypothetical protein